MHALDPRCEKCKIVTVLPETLERTDSPHGWRLVGVPPDNMATFQHKYHKRHPLRGKTNNLERTFLLWCYRCNREDGIQISNKIQKGEL